MGSLDDTESVVVNLVACDCVFVCNRFRQQRIVIYGHATTPEDLPDGRRVLDSALRPERIQSARNAEPGPRSHVSLINLPVVSDCADRARGPVFWKAQLLAKFAFGADQALDIGIGRFQRILD